MATDTNILKRAWKNILNTLYSSVSAQTEQVERAIGMSRLYEQLWHALDESEQAAEGWPYPLDIYVGDDGSSLFSIVAQNGKLYQVPLTVAQDNLTLGTWTQVTETYEPVTQNNFSITRQKNGTYRWTSIAATTVLNRVGEIDSSELFDNFIKHAQETGNYPRLDFYHLGSTNPEMWEYGTADYLARDGFCYIASGLFDEDHPLTKATIRAYEENPGVWGNSIEFYSWAEPEIILLDPEVQVPMYRDGENTRISVVKEEDAASLFTRIGVMEEKVRIMDSRIEAKLKELFGDDEAALLKFIENADGVNRAITDEKLIHRTKRKVNPEPVDSDEDEDDTEDDEDEDEDNADKDKKKEPTAQSLVLDDEAINALAEQLSNSGALAQITQSLNDLASVVAELKTARETDSKEISRLVKANGKLSEQVKALSVDDSKKKQEYLQDLPARRQIQATYRRREQEDAIEDEDGDSAVIAKRILDKLPTY